MGIVEGEKKWREEAVLNNSRSKVLSSVYSDLSTRKGSNSDVHRMGTGILKGKGRSMPLEGNVHKDAGFKEILMVLPQTWQ